MRAAPTPLTSERIKEIRHKLCLSTTRFGLALGYEGKNVSVQVRQLESGLKTMRPPMERLAIMFERFGVPADFLPPIGAEPADGEP